MRLRFPIPALLLVLAVLSLCWRHDRPERLDRYDQRFYLGIAFDLRHHARFTDGFLFAGGDDRTIRPPGMRFAPLYPALLAAATAISPGFAASTDCVVAHRGDATGCTRDGGSVRALQFGMLTACFWMIWWQASRIGRARTGWIALILALPTAPLLLLSVDYLMTETASLFLVLCAQSAMVAAVLPDRRPVPWAVASGLMLGLATLTRPGFEALVAVSVLVAAAIALHRPVARPAATAFVLAAILPIGAWVARNALVMHRAALTFGYASHTFVQRLSFDTMDWHEYGRSFVCWMPDGNGIGALLFGRGACDRFGWDDHARSFYAIGIGPMLETTLQQAGGWANQGAFLLRHFLLTDPVRQIGWHLAVTVPLALRGLFVDHWWGFALSAPLAVVTARALRAAQGHGAGAASACRFLIAALPGWFMLLLNAAVAVNQVRYNLMLVSPLAIAAALAIDAPRRRGGSCGPSGITGHKRTNLDRTSMQDRIDLRTTAILAWVVRLGSLVSALMGAAILFGWVVLAIDHDTVLPHPLIAPPTAMGLLLCGSSLALLQAGRRRAAFTCATLLLLLAGVLGLLRLLRFDDPLTVILLGDLRPSRLGRPIRIAGTSAASLVLFSVGMLAMASRWRLRRSVLMATSLPGLALTGLTLILYAYDVDPHSAIGFYQNMSPHTAIGLFVLFLTSLAIEPEQGWLMLLMSGRPSARASRAQILLVVTIPLLAGFLLLQGERAHVITLGAAMATMVVCTVVPLVVQILRDGRMLDLLETRRRDAVAAEALISDELERRVRDRTARLAQSEARLRGFVHQSVDGLALLRLDRDGGLNIETVSPSLAGLYGNLPNNTHLPQPARNVLPPDIAAELRAHVATCIATRAPYRYRAQRNTRNGQRLLDVILAPIAAEGIGAEQLFAASVRDITDAELREEQLRQSQKMEAVGQLTGGLAHDFNNLLAGISGSLEMIQSRIANQRTDGVERYLATAQEAGRRAAALTHRLLAFSRRQTLDPRPVEIDRIVADMEDLVRRTMGPAVTVVVRPSPLPWTCLIDANQFENALLNLCLNARDAMPGGGRLTITTFNDVVSSDGALPDLPAGDYVRVRVADTGVGMSPDLVARAFDPFFTTKPIGQGTGLGLSMIYGFARQSGGRVELLSEPGRGTFVDLQLPRQTGAEPIAALPAETMSEPAAGGGRTVLVVDDEPAIRMLVRDILDERGYRVLEAEDGAGGLKILRSGKVIDLLITDVGLPNGMNGRQLADAARALRNGLRVLFITGYAETTVIGDGALDEGMEVLTKPFTISRLMDRVGVLAKPISAMADPI